MPVVIRKRFRRRQNPAARTADGNVAAGKKVVFTPYAELYHYESKSRAMEDTPEKQFRFEKETKRFEEKWGDEMAKGDPYYNPNLSLKEADCSLRED